MPDEKGLFAALLDFSFTELVTTRKIKLLYSILLAIGVVVALFAVFKAMQESPAEGVLALIAAAVGLFLWTLFVRVLLEALLAHFRIAANTERMAGGPNP